MHPCSIQLAALLLLFTASAVHAGILGAAISWLVTYSDTQAPAGFTIVRRSNLEVKPQQIIYNNSEVPAWRGRLDTVYGLAYFGPSLVRNRCSPDRQNCNYFPGLAYPYEEYIWDPTQERTESTTPVIKVRYPAGSWSPSAVVPGGTLWYTYPYKNNPNSLNNPFSRSTAILEYEVYFPPDFDFVKGGKLPGLSGGDRLGRGCGGGVDSDGCFSFRIMWRRNGAGEAYLYLPKRKQAEDFCDPRCVNSQPVPCTVCDWVAGVSFRRGAWTFPKGEWTKLRLSVTLNTPNVTDGVIQLAVNGSTVIDYRSMNWRQYGNVSVEGITFASWFGGSDGTWAPPTDTFTLFRNFRMFYEGPVMARRSEPAAVGLSTGMQQQMVVEEFVDEP